MSISNALAEEEWDYVSLQQASSLSGVYQTYETFLPELYGYVKERVGKHCKILFIRHGLMRRIAGIQDLRNMAAIRWRCIGLL